jgi:tRNA pseudouridine65 synthase
MSAATDFELPLSILYRDAALIAVHKPSGLLVHRTGIDRHETRFAVQLLRDQSGRFVFPSHRLDKGASGVLVFAFDAESARRLSQAFETGVVRKRYQALVRGWPAEDGVIDHPLARVRDMYGDGRGEAGPPQDALSRFRCLARWEIPHRVDRYPTSRYALLELEPVTGRRHQLRRHLKHIAHPILGDATYGQGRHNRLFQDLFECRRLLLACTRIEFPHPISGAPLCLETPPAEDFARVLLGLEAMDIAASGFTPGRDSATITNPLDRVPR